MTDHIIKKAGPADSLSRAETKANKLNTRKKRRQEGRNIERNYRA